MSYFTCEKFEAQLNNLQGIVWLCASYLHFDRPKKNDNHTKTDSVRA